MVAFFFIGVNKLNKIDDLVKEYALQLFMEISPFWKVVSSSGIKPKGKYRMELNLKNSELGWMNIKYTYFKHIAQATLDIKTDQVNVIIKVTKGSEMDRKITEKFMSFC